MRRSCTRMGGTTHEPALGPSIPGWWRWEPLLQLRHYFRLANLREWSTLQVSDAAETIMRCKLTLMIDGREPQWIPTFRSTDFRNVRRNRLEREGHISSSGGTNSERFLPPEPVDLFV